MLCIAGASVCDGITLAGLYSELTIYNRSAAWSILQKLLNVLKEEKSVNIF